jgi:hypothetical protein
MKKIAILLVLLNSSFYAQVGIETTIPEAQLDIVSTNKGLLIPRVDLTSLLIESPIINPQSGALEVSTMVFHKGTNGIEAGFYYWDGIRWKGFTSENENKGLQYYVFSNTGSLPNIEKSSLIYNISNSGLWMSELNDIAQSVLRGSSMNNYMIYFTGSLNVINPGIFQLQSTSDDGVRIIIDNVTVLNQWHDQGTSTHNSSTVFLAKGKHKFEFWYYENAGGEFMQFNWLQNSNGSTGVINGNQFVIE